MRYFLIYYTANHNKTIRDGSVWGEFEEFPSRKELRDFISEEYNNTKDNIIIANIFEFKNKEDYQSFIKE